MLSRKHGCFVLRLLYEWSGTKTDPEARNPEEPQPVKSGPQPGKHIKKPWPYNPNVLGFMLRTLI